MLVDYSEYRFLFTVCITDGEAGLVYMSHYYINDIAWLHDAAINDVMASVYADFLQNTSSGYYRSLPDEFLSKDHNRWYYKEVRNERGYKR